MKATFTRVAKCPSMDPPGLAAEISRYPPGAILRTLGEPLPPGGACACGACGVAAGGSPAASAAGVVLSSYRDETQLESIMELIRKDLSEPYSVFTYRCFVHGWPHFTLLAHTVCGRLVGTVICKSELRPRTGRVRGYVAMLAVKTEFRRAGLGRLLAVEVLHRMAASCDELCLETEVTNAPALKLYESLGFVRDKRLVRYYMNGNDAFRLKCACAKAPPTIPQHTLQRHRAPLAASPRSHAHSHTATDPFHAGWLS